MEGKYRNFGVDISKDVINKYALEKFGRIPKTQVERRVIIANKLKTEICRKLEK